MTKGSILAIVVVAGYIGFELFTFHKARYRMEAPYVFNQFVAAHRAYTSCKTPEGQQYNRFVRNMGIVQQRAVGKLSEQHPQASTDDIEQLVKVRTDEQYQIVDTLVSDSGCSDIEVWKLLKRFDNYARLNLG